MQKPVVIVLALIIVSSIFLLPKLNPLELWSGKIRIAMLGCLHVGETTDAEVNYFADRLRQLNPDYVIDAGDMTEQNRKPNDRDIPGDPYTDDRMTEWYKDFMVRAGIWGGDKWLGCALGGHGGWFDNNYYYDGQFRITGLYSDTFCWKIGNFAFIFLGFVNEKPKVPWIKAQRDWVKSKIRELAEQDYTIFVVRHHPLWKTTSYSDEDGDPVRGAWSGETQQFNIWTSQDWATFINGLRDEGFNNVIMFITAHIHVDEDEVDAVGRSSFMDWRAVQGDSHYLQIECYVLNCGSPSTTMHSHYYTQHIDCWYMDLEEGNSFFDLYGKNVETGVNTQHHQIALPTPIRLGEPEYEQQWSPCKLNYPNVFYPDTWSVGDHKLEVKSGTLGIFECKFRYDQPTSVKAINVVTEGGCVINKEIAYSDDKFIFSAFQDSIPQSKHKYWKIRLTINAFETVKIYDCNLELGIAPPPSPPPTVELTPETVLGVATVSIVVSILLIKRKLNKHRRKRR